jgi:hypothetical protein
VELCCLFSVSLCLCGSHGRTCVQATIRPWARIFVLFVLFVVYFLGTRLCILNAPRARASLAAENQQGTS